MTNDIHTRSLDARVPNWTPPAVPSRVVLTGRFARLEPLSADDHADLLHDAYVGHDALWDYMPYGPFDTASLYRNWVRETVANPAHFFYAIRNLATGDVTGVASFLRIDPHAGSIEVGHINFAPVLQRTPAATEAMALMMGWVFESGYRRYEWKCNALNAGSRRAAQRFGFSYEGVFRQATVIKGRNRDTAWFAIIDSEWPRLKTAFDRWLDPENFDESGKQIARLGDLTTPVRVSSDPTL